MFLNQETATSQSWQTTHIFLWILEYNEDGSALAQIYGTAKRLNSYRDTAQNEKFTWNGKVKRFMDGREEVLRVAMTRFFPEKKAASSC